jgi:hypothetical protein
VSADISAQLGGINCPNLMKTSCNHISFINVPTWMSFCNYFTHFRHLFTFRTYCRANLRLIVEFRVASVRGEWANGDYIRKM